MGELLRGLKAGQTYFITEMESYTEEEASRNEINHILVNIQTAEQLKSEGNEYFKQGDLDNALKKYAKVFLFTNGLLTKSGSFSQYAKATLTDAQEINVNEIMHTTYANMTAVHLKQKKYVRTIEKANKALEIRDNPKVLYRRGMAYLYLDDLDRAKADLDEVNKQQPRDANIQAALKMWNSKLKESTEKQKKQFAGMFDR